MTKNEKRTFLIVFLLALLGLLFVWYFDRPAYEQYSQVESVQNAKELEQVASKTNNLEYDIVYSPKCKDCQHVESTMKPYLKKINKHQSLLMYNVKHPEIKKLMLSNNIHQTPTIIVQYHGKILYKYSGADKKAIKKILSGINPETKKPFDKNSQLTYYRNDYDDTKSIQPITSLTYKINPNIKEY